MRFLNAALEKAPTPHIKDFVTEARLELDKVSQPVRKDEEWRLLKLNPLFSTNFELPTLETPTSIVTSLTKFTKIPESKGSTLSVVNGKVNLAKSNLGKLGSSVFVGSLEEAPSYVFESLEARKKSPFSHEYFDLLNRSILEDIICIHIAKDETEIHPLHIAYSSTGENIATSSRLFILLEKGASLTLVESWEGENHYFNLPATECLLNENATLKHIRVQDEAIEATHIARVSAELESGATYDSVSISFGAKLSRTDYIVSHHGPNSNSRIDGLAAIGTNQVSDTHSVIDNRSAHCQSHQLHKCVIDGNGHAIFNGRILVQKDAQKIDAYQLNRNLLLSEKAKINTKPQLEILADDVRCSHGATIGQLDEEQLFYLESRGLPYDEARAMLTYAFAAEVISHIEIPSLRERLESITKTRTQGML